MAQTKLGQVIADATSLEITSLLVESISGRKFPGITTAFVETLSAWAYQVRTLIENLKKDRITVDDDSPINDATLAWINEKRHMFQLGRQNRFIEFAEKKIVNKVLNIDEMEDFRKNVIERIVNKQPAADYSMEMLRLLRVQTRLMLLKNRFKEYFENFKENPGLKPPAGEMLELRKLWELKNGFVFAQGTVQLDGDIISRNNIRLFRQKQLARHIPLLFDFHKSNMNSGLKHWHFIIEAIGKVAKVIGEKLVSPFG